MTEADCSSGGEVERRHERELSEMSRLLEEADRDKAQFLMKLAHEFRNTLSPILYAMEIQKRDADAPTQARSRRVMERQIAHLARLVDDLTDFSQISSGRLRLEKKATDLNRVLQEAVESARGLISASGQTLALQLSPEPVVCECDELRLAQVFGNLLTNAAKYGKPGASIEVQLTRQPGAALISVSDAGIGIEAHMLPRIFDLFVQTPEALRRSEGGLGIGLAIVRQLVSLHGGSVEAHSDGPGRGSRFSVRLPIQ